ncbi:MAG TPA: hypothetical protein VEK13_00450 [Thermoplasmata archaeon]|nr:hypothetical protein [Thermoplasmata archaeon]
MTDSTSFDWHARPGVILATRHLRTHAIPVRSTPLAELPRLSKKVIRFGLRLFPGLFDHVDLSFPIIVAGKDWYKITLDGRHRISKATWTGRSELPAVRVPVWFALELLIPGVYEIEWLGLILGRKLPKRATSFSILRARKVRVAHSERLPHPH